MQPSETEFKLGDVVRYAPERDNRWCREGTAEAIQSVGKVILVDTYWGRYDGDSRALTDAELASAELIFNIGGYDELDRYGQGSRDQWMRYAPADREQVTAQHGLQARWFIRKGAVEDLDTQIANAQELVGAAQEAVRSAENRLEWATQDLASLQAKHFAVSRG